MGRFLYLFITLVCFWAGMDCAWAQTPTQRNPDAPLPTADEFEMFAGESLTINPLGNDNDPTGQALILVRIGNPSAELEVNELEGGLLAIKAVGRSGEYSFDYVAGNKYGLETTSLITVLVKDVLAENTPPRAVDDSYELEAGKSLIIFPMENDSDLETQTLSLDAPQNVEPGITAKMGIGGSYQILAGNIPGIYRFTYTVTDAECKEDTASITITIVETKPKEATRSTARLLDYGVMLQGMAEGLTNDFETSNPLISELPSASLWPELKKLEDKISAAPKCSADVKDRASDISLKLSQMKARTSGIKSLSEVKQDWADINAASSAALPRINEIINRLPRRVPRSEYSGYDQAIGTELDYIGDLDVERLALMDDLEFYQPENWDQESFDDVSAELKQLYGDIADCPIEKVDAAVCTGKDCPQEPVCSGPDCAPEPPGIPWWAWPVAAASLLGAGLIGYMAKGRPAPMPAKSAAARRIHRINLRRREDEGIPFGKSPLLASVTEPGPPPKEPAGHKLPVGLQTLTGPYAVLREAYRATGRIGFAQEGVPTNDDVSLGTGFLIAPNLIMTNQHVYELYKQYLEGPECGGIEFIAERDRDASDYYAFYGSPPTILPELDIAIFRLKDKVSGRTPIDRIHVPTDDLDKREVIVVGYPCPFEVDDYILKLVEPDPIFAVKRVTQGFVFRHSTDKDAPFGIFFKVNPRVNPAEKMPAVCHNATTLAGNSGSPVLCAKSGKLIGVHFAGSRSLFGKEAANLAMAIELILAKDAAEEG